MIDLEKENIILEIRQLVNGINSAKDEINVYCDLVKQLLLSNSSQN